MAVEYGVDVLNTDLAVMQRICLGEEENLTRGEHLSY